MGLLATLALNHLKLIASQLLVPLAEKETQAVIDELKAHLQTCVPQVPQGDKPQ